MPAGDNPHSISEKKAALRESPKQPKNAVVNQQARASPFLKAKVKAEIVGTKRPQPSGPLSPTNHHVPGNPVANGHLVYVRRKLETDHSKGGISAGAESATSLSSKKPVVGGLQEQSLKHQNSVPNFQSAPVSASPAAGASAPALHSANLPANLSFGNQSPGKVCAHPGAATTASPPQCNTQLASVSASPAAAASVPALHSASLPANLSFGRQSPGKVCAHLGVAATASPPQRNAQSAPVSASPAAAAAASVPALHSASLPANLSFGKQSPGKVSVHPSVAATASPPQRNTQLAPISAAPAVAAPVPALHSASLPSRLSFGKQSPGKVTVQSSVAVTASPPQRNVVPTAMPQNLTAANTASPPHRNVVRTAMPQNHAASPPQRNVVPTAMPQNFTAATSASPTHRNGVSTAVPQNCTAANMAPCNVAAASTASRHAVATSTARSPANSERSSNQDWKQRFIRLQEFLRNNEQTGQEEYICMLQSMSSVGRSKHAIELEKRAVNLLIEEGKELQKMKALNVLGKLPPTDHPTQPTFYMRLPFQPFPAPHR